MDFPCLEQVGGLWVVCTSSPVLGSAFSNGPPRRHTDCRNRNIAYDHVCVHAVLSTDKRHSILGCAKSTTMEPNPQSITVRPATAGDQPFLERTFLASMQAAITAARGRWNEEHEVRQFREQLDLRSTHVIEVADSSVGFYTLRLCPSEAELHTICVRPRHQNQGVGTFIIQELLALVRAQDIPLALSVLKANRRALALYKRLGFQAVGETQHHTRLCLGSSSTT